MPPPRSATSSTQMICACAASCTTCVPSVYTAITIRRIVNGRVGRRRWIWSGFRLRRKRKRRRWWLSR
jgi:hypothetical protein